MFMNSKEVLFQSDVTFQTCSRYISIGVFTLNEVL